MYVYYKNKTNKLIRTAKQIFCETSLSNACKNPKQLWNLYKQVMYNTDIKNKQGVTALEINNELIEDEQTISEKLNEYFLNVTEEISCSNDPIDKDYISLFPTPINFPINLTPTDTNEILSIINNLKLGAATGIDEISCKFIKFFANRLEPLFVKHANTMLNDQTFPNCLKTAIVAPIHKCGITTNPNNYRPISVLNSISKIFEKVIKIGLTFF